MSCEFKSALLPKKVRLRKNTVGPALNVAGKFPINDIVKNRAEINQLKYDQRRKSLSSVVPPVPEEVETIKRRQQEMYQQVRKNKQRGQKYWNNVVITHTANIPQATMQDNLKVISNRFG